MIIMKMIIKIMIIIMLILLSNKIYLKSAKTWFWSLRPKRCATAVPNSIDRIKFDLSTAVARHLKPSCATSL